MKSVTPSPIASQMDQDDGATSDDDAIPKDDDSRCPTIALSTTEKKQLRKPWKHSLIIKLFNGALGYMQMMKRLKTKWPLKGEIALLDLGFDSYIVKFSCWDDYNHVLTEGPWMINDHYLTIRQWAHNFIPDDTLIRFLTAWIRIPNLPVEYFDVDFLHKVGEKVGKVVRIDKQTALAKRGQFVRLSVEVDLAKPLLSKFRLRGRV